MTSGVHVSALWEARMVDHALAKAVGGVLDGPALPVIDPCSLQVLVEVHAGALIHMHLHSHSLASCAYIHLHYCLIHLHVGVQGPRQSLWRWPAKLVQRDGIKHRWHSTMTFCTDGLAPGAC